MARKESRAQLEKGRSEVQEEIKQLQRYIEHTGNWVGERRGGERGRRDRRREKERGEE